MDGRIGDLHVIALLQVVSAKRRVLENFADVGVDSQRALRLLEDGEEKRAFCFYGDDVEFILTVCIQGHGAFFELSPHLLQKLRP